MAKFSINLLPPEVLTKEKNKYKVKLINRLSIVFLVVLITITAGVLTLRLIQNRQLSNANDQLKQITQTVDSLNVQENLLLNLKKRLTSIATLAKQPLPKGQVFDSISALIPPTTKTKLLSLDKSNSIVISGESSDSGQLQIFFNNLIEPQTGQSIVSQVKVENLSQAANSKYRFEINAKFVQ